MKYQLFNSIKLYNQNKQKMLSKQASFCLFQNCCSPPQLNQNDQYGPQNQRGCEKERKEEKMSLKKMKNQLSQLKPFKQDNYLSINKSKGDHSGHTCSHSREQGTTTTNRTFFSPFEKNCSQFFPLRQKMVQTTLKRQGSHKPSFSHLHSQNSFNFAEIQLQKTTKVFSPKPSFRPTENQLNESGLKKTKQLTKGQPISKLTNLSSFKQSIVSQNFDSQSIHHKLQESVILVDYFNPPSSRILQVQDYLIRRS